MVQHKDPTIETIQLNSELITTEQITEKERYSTNNTNKTSPPNNTNQNRREFCGITDQSENRGFLIFKTSKNGRTIKSKLNKKSILHKTITETFKTALTQKEDKHPTHRKNATQQFKYSHFFKYDGTSYKITINGISGYKLYEINLGKGCAVKVKLRQGYKYHNHIIKAFLKGMGLWKKNNK